MLSSITSIRSRKGSVSREPKTHCDICQAKFQLIILQQHLCKRCSRSVCDHCFTHRIKVYQSDSSAPILKVCLVCWKEDELISSLITQNHLFFQVTSRIGDDWVKKINKDKLSFQQIVNQYEEMKFQTTENTIKFKSQSLAVFQNLFKSCHYSLRHFVGKMTDQMNPETIYQSFLNITVALYAYLKNMPYTYELVYIVIFVLCFCSETHTFFVLSRLIDKIYPQYMRLQRMNKGSLLSNQIKMLMDMYRVLSSKAQKQELAAISNYLQTRFLFFIKSFTINAAKVSVSFTILDETINSYSYIPLYKGIVSLLYNSKEVIEQFLDPSVIESYIINSVGLEKMKTTLTLFQRSNVKFEMQTEIFDSAEHLKLNERYKELQQIYLISEDRYKNLQKKNSILAKQKEQTALKLAQYEARIMNLQEQLLDSAEKMVMIEQYENMKEQNETLLSKNEKLQEYVILLQSKYEDLNKKYTLEQVTRKMYIKFQEDHNKEIVELKTKNEVYEIQRQANNIDFNTSYIELKMEEKNNKILELEKINNEIHMELDFYRNSRPNSQISVDRNHSQELFQKKRTETFQFLNNLSEIGKNQENFQNFSDFSMNLTAFQSNNGQQKSSLKKILETNKQVIEKLKSNLKSSEIQRSNFEKEVKCLSQTVEEQKIQLELIGQINAFISHIPEEINYSNSIEDLQKMIEVESNLHKKTQLEGILTNFKKCVYEVRYRTIDAKLKENKIKEDKIISKEHRDHLANEQFLTSPLMLKKMTSMNQSEISNQLTWMGNSDLASNINKKIEKKDDCSIM